MEEILELANKVSEGINFLSVSEKLERLRYSDLVPKLKEQIGKFLSTKDILDLNNALQSYRSSNVMVEGAGAYDETIWNANVHVQGKETTLEDLLNDLEDDLQKFRKGGE